MKIKLFRITLDTNPEDCNYHCIMCEEHSPYSNYIRDKLNGKHRRMPAEWLEKIFESAKKLGVKEIIPSTMGEPLLYKHFLKIVELCKKYNIQMNLTTNASFPKLHGLQVQDWAQFLVPIISDVKFSFNGAKKHTQEKIMQSSNFEKVLENIQVYVLYRNQYFEKFGYYSSCSFQITFMQSNLEEIPEIIKLASEMDIDRVKGHHLWVHTKEMQKESLRKDKESMQKWNETLKQCLDVQKNFPRKNGKLVKLENFFPLSGNDSFVVHGKYECPFLGRELWISAEGKISPCCAPDELRSTLGEFGNIQTTSLEEVLSSQTYQELIRTYKQKEVCKMCNMRKPV